MSITQRIECLNSLLSQPVVLGQINEQKLAEAASGTKDRIMKALFESIASKEGANFDAAQLFSRVMGTERSEEVKKTVQGVASQLGIPEAADICVSAMGDTEAQRTALLKAVVEVASSDANFWDIVIQGSKISKIPGNAGAEHLLRGPSAEAEHADPLKHLMRRLGSDTSRSRNTPISRSSVSPEGRESGDILHGKVGWIKGGDKATVPTGSFRLPGLHQRTSSANPSPSGIRATSSPNPKGDVRRQKRRSVEGAAPPPVVS